MWDTGVPLLSKEHDLSEDKPGYVRPRSKNIQFRCSPEEWEVIAKNAEEAGLKISTYARLRAMKTAIQPKHKKDGRTSQ